MAKAVVNGAMLQCTCGTTPSALIVTSQQQVKIGNQLAATVMDNAFTTNIPPFGPCSALTAKASGVSTPCALVAAGPWMPGSTSIVKIGNQKALLDTDKLNCTAGPGVISVSNPGQPQTSDT
ncbi:MAG: DUF4280 domain-containing protein [Phycisphaerae bacterium]|jgi:hypothetical protein